MTAHPEAPPADPTGVATRRLAVLAHFDPHGEVAPHVRRCVAAISAFADHLVVVSSADLTAESRMWLEANAELVMRPNVGHDFSSYRAGLDRRDLSPFTELMVMNDSAVFPLVPLDRLFTDMDDRPADFWGLTIGYGFVPHVQSYFVVFRETALRSPAFGAFWRDVEAGDRSKVITEYEVGLSRTLCDAGLRMDSYLRPSAFDRLEGAARAGAVAARGYARDRRWRKLLGWTRRTVRHARHPEWNAAAALADRGLGRRVRLPAVKLSTLRDDPYVLDSHGLLAACEERHPDAFAGVREYLARTDGVYGGRWARTSAHRPAWLSYRMRRPVRRGIRSSIPE